MYNVQLNCYEVQSPLLCPHFFATFLEFPDNRNVSHRPSHGWNFYIESWSHEAQHADDPAEWFTEPFFYVMKTYINTYVFSSSILLHMVAQTFYIFLLYILSQYATVFTRLTVNIRGLYQRTVRKCFAKKIPIDACIYLCNFVSILNFYSEWTEYKDESIVLKILKYVNEPARTEEPRMRIFRVHRQFFNFNNQLVSATGPHLIAL